MKSIAQWHVSPYGHTPRQTVQDWINLAQNWSKMSWYRLLITGLNHVWLLYYLVSLSLKPERIEVSHNPSWDPTKETWDIFYGPFLACVRNLLTLKWCRPSSENSSLITSFLVSIDSQKVWSCAAGFTLWLQLVHYFTPSNSTSD